MKLMTLCTHLWQRFRQQLVFLILLLITALCSTVWAQTIIVLADTPYSDDEKFMLQGPNGVLFRLINEAKPSVIMHLGDLKSGGKSCTDELLKEHKALLAQIYPGKMIYTPGDNDWTDCDRSSLTYSFDELERLEFLIKLIYQTPPRLDDKLPAITEQPNQVENKLWINNRLAISTIHLVGTSNGRVYIGKSNTVDAIKTADRRDSNNLKWLKEIEHNAEKFDALIIGFQADIYQESVLESGPCTDSKMKSCDAFAIYRQAFLDLAKRINKPVLVSHGDTGDFCFEQLDKNLWHLNAAGDFRYIDGTSVTFNKDSTTRPFTIKGLLKPNLPHIGCNN